MLKSHDFEGRKAYRPKKASTKSEDTLELDKGYKKECNPQLFLNIPIAMNHTTPLLEACGLVSAPGELLLGFVASSWFQELLSESLAFWERIQQGLRCNKRRRVFWYHIPACVMWCQPNHPSRIFNVRLIGYLISARGRGTHLAAIYSRRP